MQLSLAAREHAVEMSFAEHDHVVQAFPPDAPDEAFGIRILPRAPRGREHLGHAQARHPPVKDLAIDRIAVAEEIPRCPAPREGLDQLLRRPLGGRMLGDIKVENAPTVAGQHDQNEEHPETDCRDDEEIQRDALSQVVLEKDSP